jgi:cation:H+ antiporter
MIGLVIWVIVLIVSLFILIKAADYFTDSAEKLGLYFGLTPVIVGATIVALGTSIPELATSIVSVIRGSPEIVMGNVIGSNIANILFVLGLAALFSSIVIDFKFHWLDKPMFLISTLILWLFAYFGGIALWEALFLISLYIVYAISVIISKKTARVKKELSWRVPVFLVMSAIFIYFGAEYVVQAIVNISVIAGFGTDVIAASAVALGTSLPEFVVSLTAVRKKNYAMAIGNVIGSNIFNALMVVGISGLFLNLPVATKMLSLGLPIMTFAAFLLFLMLSRKNITKTQGIILFAIYLLFLWGLFY